MNYGSVGVILVALSFLHWFLPFTLVNISTAHVLFLTGNIIFFDYISFKFSRYSLLRLIRDSKILLKWVLCALLFVFLIELYAHWLGKYWYFPLVDVYSYFIVIIPLLVVYTFYLLETYFGIKALVTTFSKRTNQKFKTLFHLTKVRLLLKISTLCFVISTFILFSSISSSSIQEFLSVDFAPQNEDMKVFILVFLCALFLSLALECLLYQSGTPSLLSYSASGNLIPLFSILIAAILSALFYEGFNAPAGFWRYSNIPFSGLSLFNVPLLVFLGWPFQYPICLSLYAIFGRTYKIKM